MAGRQLASRRRCHQFADDLTLFLLERRLLAPLANRTSIGAGDIGAARRRPIGVCRAYCRNNRRPGSQSRIYDSLHEAC